MKTKLDRTICDNGLRFEWVGRELFIVKEQMHEDACWVKSDLMHDIREAGEHIKGEPDDIYIIERDEKGDKHHKVIEVVVFPGGDTLFYIDPDALS